jgi:hypothetical protein
MIDRRAGQRAPNLTTRDRSVLGLLSLFLNPRRLARSAIIIKPATLLRFHNAMKKRKYRLLYSPKWSSWTNTPVGLPGSQFMLKMSMGLPSTACPMSHPFVERLIGSVRRKLLDQASFWTATDLENKLRGYQVYHNGCRTHSGRQGATPMESGANKVVDISDYRWKKYCRGLFQLPVAA